eukprot:7387701-Prymnesium_polylepis.1
MSAPSCARARTPVEVGVAQVEALARRVVDEAEEVALRRTALRAAAAGRPARGELDERVDEL